MKMVVEENGMKMVEENGMKKIGGEWDEESWRRTG
jgi:hypothetical protein